MPTARGVYLDINESPIHYDIMVNDKNLSLYFSSNFLKGRFVFKYEQVRSKYEKILKKLWETDYSLLLILYTYKNVEKRGFRVYYNNKVLDDKSKIRIEV